MPGSRGTEDGEIGLRLSHALRDVAINTVARNGEIGNCVRHPRFVAVAHPDDLGIGMLIHLAQEIAHVHVLEAQADAPPFSHLTLLSKALNPPSPHPSS